MGLFRRRAAPEPIPVVIVRPDPPRRLPWAAIAGAVLIAVLAAAGLTRAGAQPSAAGGTAPPIVYETPEPTSDPGLDAAIAAADRRIEATIAAKDAKCAKIEDVEAGTKCTEESTALSEQETRLDECMTDILHVAEVARCEKQAAHP